MARNEKKATRKLERLTGRVAGELVRRGTASEHRAIVLHSPAGDRLILQRIGGNAFDDAETKELEGHAVRVEGFRLGDVFRFTKVERSD